MKAIRFPLVAILVVVSGVALLTGCTASSTGEIDNPVLRRATWIDFISAGDIRQNCRPGAAERIRFVLNANRAEQVRIYDLNAANETLRIRVLTPKQRIDEIRLDNSITRFFNPSDMTVRLSERDTALILSAYRKDLAAPRSELPSELLTEWHFWLVGACLDGKFTYDAWVNPGRDFLALTFPENLLRRDISNIPLNLPPGERLTIRDYNPERQQGYDHYILHLREDRVILGQNYGLDKSK
ncbi:hypothetical protein EOI86_03985 [Hwanghaeella grinnelliae]|uniref:Lipoprotein n=1 Tax=Hwanghaeella grinnelliae TaxID=2500179 RepID=A0A437QVB2_9PROT|nr:hypothetical protein [Hwanghaeella grinnelliae]RVU38453.1 hypothetical protein EOI86_03985 [Hwanghaeella grinnelliae]